MGFSLTKLTFVLGELLTLIVRNGATDQNFILKDLSVILLGLDKV